MTAAIGTPLPRVDGPAKVTGAARYAAEFGPLGVLHAVAVDSPVARGRIMAIDQRVAAQAPGVVLVMTHQDAPRLHPFPGLSPAAIAVERTLPLQGPEVAYAGQKVALVVADTLERAEHAAHLLELRYETEVPVLQLDENAAERSDPRERMGEPAQHARGDADAALAAAPVRVKQTYATAVGNHHPMEPHATVAEWDGSTLTLHETTQGVVSCRNVVAAALRLDRDKVRVLSPYLGGGFGSKGPLWAHTLLAAMASMRLGRPVKLALARQQMAFSTGHRPETRQVVALGSDRDGRLLALAHDTLSHTSRVGEYLEPCGAPSTVLYAAPAIRARHTVVPLDVPTPSFMRAPGECPGSFALECAMDELAAELGLDPVELRLRNQPGAHPVSGKPWSRRDTAACLRRGAERFGWAARTPEPRSMRDGRELVGWGVACALYPGNRQPASARARMNADGRVFVQAATQDLGTGSYTIFTQIAADALDLPVERVRFELGDSTLPEGPGSGGSWTAASVGPAARQACLRLRERIAAEGMPGPGQSLEATADAAPGPEFKRHAVHSTGAQFCEVRVDELTRRVRVTRWVGVFDVGRVLNPRTARSQLIGGVVYGLGMALMEATAYDPRTGWVVTEGLADYHVPVNADVPEIDVSWLDEPDPVINEIGARGIGEIGVTGVAAAVANALHHATGRRVRRLPITAEALL